MAPVALPVLCFADELAADPALLPAFTREFGARDGVELLIYAPDGDPQQTLAALGGTIERAGLHEDGSVEATLVAVPGGSEPALAERVVALYSERPPLGAFASLAPFGPQTLSRLRLAVEHARGGPQPAPTPAVPAPRSADRPEAIAARLARLTGWTVAEVADRLFAPGPARTVEILPFGRLPVAVRPATADVTELVDAFEGLYHLPPAELRSARLVVDCGAGVGATTAHLAGLFPEARVIGLELDPDRAALATRTCAPYGGRVAIVAGDESVLDAVLPDEPVDFLRIASAQPGLFARPAGWMRRTRVLKAGLAPGYDLDTCVADLARNGFAAAQDPVHWATVVARAR